MIDKDFELYLNDMSRSRKLPVLKDKSFKKKLYWRNIRSRINQLVRVGEEELPDPKTLINDYDYIDWIYDYRTYNKEKFKDEIIKVSRK